MPSPVSVGCDFKIAPHLFVAAKELPYHNSGIHQRKHRHCRCRIQIAVFQLPECETHQVCNRQGSPQQCSRRGKETVCDSDTFSRFFIPSGHTEGQSPLEIFASPHHPELSRLRKCATLFCDISLKPFLASPKQQFAMPEDHP